MSDKPFENVDDILKHYKKREEITFKQTEDIIEYFGWGRPINLVEVRKDADGKLPGEISGTNEVCKSKRYAAHDETNISIPTDR